ncbi:MAG: hypothetical protein AAFU86_14290 [Pseudomonadota bacterium]
MTTVFTDTTPRARRTTPFATLAWSVEIRILLGVLALLVLWGLAIFTFGYPALIVPALALVPTMFVVLMLITVGK